MSKSDRHTRPQLFESGSSKRKAKKKKEEEFRSAISKTPKLDSWVVRTSESNDLEVVHEVSTSVNVVNVPSLPASKSDECQLQPETYESVQPANQSTAVLDLTSSTCLSVVNNMTDPILKPDEKIEMDVGLWKEPFSENIIEYWVKRSSADLQNADEELLRKYSAVQSRSDRPAAERRCSVNLFFRVQKNKEITSRKWLCFSPSTGKIYCYVCKLMPSTQSTTNQFAGEGFCNWKKANEKITEHENSPAHMNSILAFTLRSTNEARVDSVLNKQVSISLWFYFLSPLVYLYCWLKQYLLS